MTASGAYLLNDLIDVDHDRRHDRKRERPFAAGHLSLLHGWLLFPLLVMLGFAISSLTLPLSFLWVLTGYLVLALAYSLRLKQIVITSCASSPEQQRSACTYRFGYSSSQCSSF